MTKRTFDESLDGDLEGSFVGARPARRRVQQVQKRKSSTRSRKTRRKPTQAPGGIHQRANKRMSW
jgi:hypothetical protein